METRVKKQIVLPKGVNAHLQKIFKTNELGVRRAVKFISDSDRSKRIRVAALQCGGVLVDPDAVYIPTDHEFIITDRGMEFRFGDSYIVTWCKTTNTITRSGCHSIVKSLFYEKIKKIEQLYAILTDVGKEIKQKR